MLGLRSRLAAARKSKPIVPVMKPVDSSALVLHEYTPLRKLASRLKVEPKAIIKKIGFQRHKRIHCHWIDPRDMRPHQFVFEQLKHIALPFHVCGGICESFGVRVEFKDLEPPVPQVSQFTNDIESARTPVLVLLGHFNHGKTTLLDFLMKTSIAKRESCGITQEIRGCRVNLTKKLPVTFIDTPGQDIFHRMRSNGASVADLVILLISAQDGICQQTRESIGCAEAFDLPVIVALNKIDLKPEFQDVVEDIRRFKHLNKCPIIPVSARTGAGIDDLKKEILDQLNQYELPELEECKSLEGYGTVLDTKMDPVSGNHMLLLVQAGVVKPKNYLIAGCSVVRIRAISDGYNKTSKAMGLPGETVWVNAVTEHFNPSIPLGEPFHVIQKKHALELAFQREMRVFIPSHRVGCMQETDEEFMESFDDFESELENQNVSRVESVSDDDEEEIEDIEEDSEQNDDETRPSIHTPRDDSSPVILKTDIANTLVCIQDALDPEENKKNHALELVKASVGVVSLSDVREAESLGVPIFAYNVKIDKKAEKEAKRLQVEVIVKKTVQDTIDALFEFDEAYQNGTYVSPQERRKHGTKKSGNKSTKASSLFEAEDP